MTCKTLGMQSSPPPHVACSTCPVLRGIDQLTGARDRGALMAEMEERVAGKRPFALLLLDLDGFKQVNDQLGHPAGDRLLRAVAERLRRVLRQEDVLARLGGDEFAVLLPDLGDEDLREIGERMVNRLARPFLLDGRVAHVGGSVGCATLPRMATNATDLLRMADLALYAAKAGGRGQLAMACHALRAHADAEAQLEEGLRAAAALDQFSLDFQPQWALSNGAVTAMEALLRWDHPTWGRISPGRFIPVLERSRSIVGAGNWVLTAALAAAHGWRIQGRAPLVAVNVSAVQLRDGGFPHEVRSALRAQGLGPESLELEVTETALLQNRDAALAQLAGLRDEGVRVALDDFGTGHSSLALLHAFPFDRIKIDASFLRGAAADARGSAIMAAIVGLATALGVPTTAEGVEDEGQLEQARRIGCTEVQGYLTGRPMSTPNTAALLRGVAPNPFDMETNAT